MAAQLFNKGLCITKMKNVLAAALTHWMEAILGSYEAPLRSNLQQKNTGPVGCMHLNGTNVLSLSLPLLLPEGEGTSERKREGESVRDRTIVPVRFEPHWTTGQN